MPTIRIPKEHWGKVWGVLVAAGPISRISQEPIYFVGKEHIRVLRKKKLPFEIIETPNGRTAGNRYGKARPPL